MILTSGNIIIDYKFKDENLARTLVCELETQSKRVKDFFEISKQIEAKVILYSEIELFKQQYEKKVGGKYEDWLVGFATKGNEIHILSLDCFHKTKSHENDTLNDLLKVIVHEYVHICHFSILEENAFPILMEGFATFLAGQSQGAVDNLPDLDFMLNHFYELGNPYQVAYSFVKSITERFSHKQVLEIAKRNSLIIKYWEK